MKTWKTARLITLLHSPSCLRLYARQSGEKERGSRTNNAAPQTYPPFLAFYSTLPPLLRLSSHSRDEERIRSATLFATASRGGPLYTMLNYEDGNFDLILSNYDWNYNSSCKFLSSYYQALVKKEESPSGRRLTTASFLFIRSCKPKKERAERVYAVFLPRVINIRCRDASSQFVNIWYLISRPLYLVLPAWRRCACSCWPLVEGKGKKSGPKERE